MHRQDERFQVGEAAAADIAELIAWTNGPGGHAPGAAECIHMSAAVMADQYEVRCRLDECSCRASAQAARHRLPDALR